MNRRIRIQKLPSKAAAYLWLRRLVGTAGVAALILGTAASIDDFFASLRVPPETVHTYPGESIELSGSLPDLKGDEPPQLSVSCNPATDRIAINGSTISSARISGKLVWRTTITVLPSTTPGTYHIDVSLLAPENATAASLYPPVPSKRLEVYASAEAMHAASSSFFLSTFGWKPFSVALRSLFAALAAGLLFPAVNRLLGRALVEKGYLRVYHTKEEGDDTLLYCVDPQSAVAEDRPYPVLSAAGQLLGVAAVTERGRRYCVLRLSAARARAGCLIAINT